MMKTERSFVSVRVVRDEVEPKSRAQWRRWLAKHHRTATGVWLILRKKSAGPQPLTVEQAVEEALCFGWIDSRLRPLDDQRSALLFTPRRPKSVWSRINKQRVEVLIERGLMTDAGLATIERARANGSWEALDAIEDLRVPDDLAAALAADPVAEANFTALAPSARKQVLWWIASAKRAETRARRIAETVRSTAARRKVGT